MNYYSDQSSEKMMTTSVEKLLLVQLFHNFLFQPHTWAKLMRLESQKSNKADLRKDLNSKGAKS